MVLLILFMVGAPAMALGSYAGYRWGWHDARSAMHGPVLKGWGAMPEGWRPDGR